MDEVIEHQGEDPAHYGEDEHDHEGESRLVLSHDCLA